MVHTWNIGTERFPRTLAHVQKGLGTEYSGAAVAVVKNDTVLLRAILGDRQTYSGNMRGQMDPLPLTLDTRFDMASVTKLAATTQVALRLLEAGEITLFDSVSRYFADSGNYGDVNLRHLMTHTSGLTPHISLLDHCHDPSEIASVILQSKPLSAPGESVHYSCMGYILLQKILEKVTGTPLDVLANELVFKPLGMKTAAFNPVGGDFAATEYSPYRGHYITGVVHDENAHFGGGVSGNAGLFASIDDMIAFAKMLSKRGEGFLHRRTFELAVHNYTHGLEEARGLGFQLNDYDLCSSGDVISPLSYGHNGFTGTSVYCDSQTGVAVILLTNAVHYGRENRTAFFRDRRIFHTLAFLESDDCLLTMPNP